MRCARSRCYSTALRKKPPCFSWRSGHGALGAFSRRLFPPLPLGGGQILRDCVTNGREGAQIRKDRLQIVIG